MPHNTPWEDDRKRKRIAKDGERITVTMAMMDDAQRETYARYRPGYRFLPTPSDGSGRVTVDDWEAQADAAWDEQTKFLANAWRAPPNGLSPSFHHSDRAPEASASPFHSPGVGAGAEGDPAEAAWLEQGEWLREAWRGPRA